jgi:hypothetical protein
MFTSRKLIVHVLVALMLFVSVSSAAAAPASAKGNTQISGVGVFTSTAECSDRPSPYYPPLKMAGGLVGCWYTDWLEVTHDPANGTYQERGTETFVGCLADGTTCGTFSTVYKFTAKLAADGSEIHGHCEHPLVSGTGDFTGIWGQVNIRDDVQAAKYPYDGHFKLP